MPIPKPVTSLRFKHGVGKGVSSLSSQGLREQGIPGEIGACSQEKEQISLGSISLPQSTTPPILSSAGLQIALSLGQASAY